MAQDAKREMRNETQVSERGAQNHDRVTTMAGRQDSELLVLFSDSHALWVFGFNRSNTFEANSLSLHLNAEVSDVNEADV